MSYHFCCFRTLNQDPCPIDFSRSGQEVLSVVWKMCNTAFQWYLMPLSKAVASIIIVTSHLVKCSLTQRVAETHLLIGPCLRSADTCHGSKSKATEVNTNAHAHWFHANQVEDQLGFWPHPCLWGCPLAWQLTFPCMECKMAVAGLGNLLTSFTSDIIDAWSLRPSKCHES